MNNQKSRVVFDVAIHHAENDGGAIKYNTTNINGVEKVRTMSYVDIDNNMSDVLELRYKKYATDWATTMLDFRNGILKLEISPRRIYEPPESVGAEKRDA